MTRILSRHGNVIAADFRKRAKITLRISSEILYRDEHVMLTRSTAYAGEKPVMVIHFVGDFKTGEVTKI